MISSEMFVAISGAVISIIIAVISAILSRHNDIALQTRKLKEEHYINFIESLHSLMSLNNNSKNIEEYTKYRDKLFIVASEEVVSAILDYENIAVGKTNELHDEYLTKVVKAIRKDLRIRDRRFPVIGFKRG